MRLAAEIPDLLRVRGLIVDELGGWQGRGYALGAVTGMLGHHTATGLSWTPSAIDELLVEGRADLPGPLYQIGVRRDASVAMVADGRANHAGYAPLPWLGNDRRRTNPETVGVAFYCNGVDEPISDAMWETFVVIVDVLSDLYGFGVDHVAPHSEHDTRGKPDPAGPVWFQAEGGTWDAPVMRAALALDLDPLPEDTMDRALITSTARPGWAWRAAIGQPLVPIGGAPTDFAVDGDVVLDIDHGLGAVLLGVPGDEDLVRGIYRLRTDVA